MIVMWNSILLQPQEVFLLIYLTLPFYNITFSSCEHFCVLTVSGETAHFCIKNNELLTLSVRIVLLRSCDLRQTILLGKVQKQKWWMNCIDLREELLIFRAKTLHRSETFNSYERPSLEMPVRSLFYQFSPPLGFFIPLHPCPQNTLLLFRYLGKGDFWIEKSYGNVVFGAVCHTGRYQRRRGQG